VTGACGGNNVRCGGESPTRHCVPGMWLCDGDNDCGNNWDEDPANCGELNIWAHEAQIQTISLKP